MLVEGGVCGTSLKESLVKVEEFKGVLASWESFFLSKSDQLCFHSIPD